MLNVFVVVVVLVISSENDDNTTKMHTNGEKTPLSSDSLSNLILFWLMP